MACPSDTLGSSWPPLTLRPCSVWSATKLPSKVSSQVSSSQVSSSKVGPRRFRPPPPGRRCLSTQTSTDPNFTRLESLDFARVQTSILPCWRLPYLDGRKLRHRRYTMSNGKNLSFRTASVVRRLSRGNALTFHEIFTSEINTKIIVLPRAPVSNQFLKGKLSWMMVHFSGSVEIPSVQKKSHSIKWLLVAFPFTKFKK
jgi:hypothetical protein